MKKMYISAPIAMFRKQGLNWEKYFNDKEKEYIAKGYVVSSPVWIGKRLEAKHRNNGLNHPTEADYMTECSRVLYEGFYKNPENCYMSMHPMWQQSVGCKCEYGIALGLGINIIFEQ